MKTIAIGLDLSAMPFKLDMPNVSSHLEMQMKLNDPEGYLGKVMAINKDVPFAMLFAYKDDAQPDVETPIKEVQAILGQAAIAFGGWEYWDTFRNEFEIFELKEEDSPELHARLIANLKLGASNLKPGSGTS